MTTWKDVERRLARLAGTERTGPTGKEVEDWGTDRFVFECKHRKTVPDWIYQTYLTRRKQATPARTIVTIELEDGRRLAVFSYPEMFEATTLPQVRSSLKRKSLPGWLEKALTQANRNARGRTPIVVVHKKYTRTVLAFVDEARLDDVFPPSPRAGPPLVPRRTTGQQKQGEYDDARRRTPGSRSQTQVRRPFLCPCLH